VKQTATVKPFKTHIFICLFTPGLNRYWALHCNGAWMFVMAPSIFNRILFWKSNLSGYFITPPLIWQKCGYLGMANIWYTHTGRSTLCHGYVPEKHRANQKYSMVVRGLTTSSYIAYDYTSSGHTYLYSIYVLYIQVYIHF